MFFDTQFFLTIFVSLFNFCVEFFCRYKLERTVIVILFQHENKVIDEWMNEWMNKCENVSAGGIYAVMQPTTLTEV